jgi:hypothetical protein
MTLAVLVSGVVLAGPRDGHRPYRRRRRLRRGRAVGWLDQ